MIPDTSDLMLANKAPSKYFASSWIYPKELKSGSWEGICTPIVIAPLFTRAKGRNNLMSIGGRMDEAM